MSRLFSYLTAAGSTGLAVALALTIHRAFALTTTGRPTPLNTGPKSYVNLLNSLGIHTSFFTPCPRTESSHMKCITPVKNPAPNWAFKRTPTLAMASPLSWPVSVPSALSGSGAA